MYTLNGMEWYEVKKKSYKIIAKTISLICNNLNILHCNHSTILYVTKLKSFQTMVILLLWMPLCRSLFHFE